MKVYKATRILSNTEFLNMVGLAKENVSKITRYDYFDYSMDKGRTYEHSFYQVTFRQ